MRLTDEQRRDVLARAEAIQSSSLAVRGGDSDMESFIQAAEEAGYPRAAVEQALREQYALPMKPPAAGELAFARSADEKFYVAEVRSSGPEGIRVRFLRGGEHTMPLEDLRPCTFLPGTRVVVPWPEWGAWTCTVDSFDEITQRVKVSSWGESHEFPISDVWLDQPPKPRGGSAKARVSVALIGASAAIGAAIGSIVTAFVLR